MIWDSHAHLLLLGAPGTIAQALSKSDYAAACVACSPDEWEALEELYSLCPDRIKPVFGLHPELALRNTQALQERLSALLIRHPGAYVGETGLDRRFPKAGQREALLMQARLSLALKRPLVLHCVGQFGALIKELQTAGFDTTSPPLLLHRYTGNAQIAALFLRSFSCYFSVHADTLRNPASRAALEAIPRERLLIESDADSRWHTDLSVQGKIIQARQAVLAISEELGLGTPVPPDVFKSSC